MQAPDSTRRRRLGVLTRGSLAGGIEAKLDAERPIESVRAGTFCVVEGATLDFFALITDLEIDAANEGILLHPPGPDDDLLRRVLQSASATYAKASLRPQLVLDRQRPDADPQTVKTIPSHFSNVGEATEEDVARVFKSEATDPSRYFEVGDPVGMEGVPVCLDLQRFVERSNAVFGKTGTGKSFLTRLLLAGAMKAGRGVALVFDMHGEYGSGRRNEEGAFAPGLADVFGSQVQVFTLDPATMRQRNQSFDAAIELYADQIEPADILPLQKTLDLNRTAAESAELMRRTYKSRWLATLIDASGERLKEIADEIGANENSLLALRRKLSRFTRHEFFHTDRMDGKEDRIEQIFEALDKGKSVVLDFGRYRTREVYLLVANVLARRLRQIYEEKVNRYEASQKAEDEPRQLLVVVEEAHHFLSPEVAGETPFGKIAREMRKFYVSLLIVDQRPSGIDEEVLSQIGTKFVAQLSDEKDIAAALVGTPGASGLRQILASLDSKQQVLLLGHAVPMPITLRTRTWDMDLAKTLREGMPGGEVVGSAHEMQASLTELF
ncbi:ATP-binding protein [Rubricoccus marinus]|uniref:ATPase n=1 Tax=Rubricoccus marinus TaxID=716817 RepID=A0A259TZC2_9BACT|nr:ATP-binding protein [Rubricoccus marinus]OZC02928.1 ATPase [Rubricoccus marinus]